MMATTLSPIPDLLHADCLVCYGKGRISRWISWGLRLRYWWRALRFKRTPSHVAFIVQYDNAPMVFESTTLSGLEDAISDTARVGVQAHEFGEWLRHYPGAVELWRLRTPQRESGEQAMTDYTIERHHDQTDYDAAQAIGSGLSVIRNTENDDALFCSEYYAFAMRKGGSIGTHINCSEVTPLDVTLWPCLKHLVNLK